MPLVLAIANPARDVARDGICEVGRGGSEVEPQRLVAMNSVVLNRSETLGCDPILPIYGCRVP